MPRFFTGTSHCFSFSLLITTHVEHIGSVVNGPHWEIGVSITTHTGGTVLCPYARYFILCYTGSLVLVNMVKPRNREPSSSVVEGLTKD